jgi:hypothetical protein
MRPTDEAADLVGSTLEREGGSMSEQDYEDSRDERGRPQRKFTINIPDREPDDTHPATEDQVRYLRKLADWKDPSVLTGLGKWQASALIDQIKDAKDDFQSELDAGLTPPTKAGAGVPIGVWIAVGFLVLLLAAWANGWT